MGMGDRVKGALQLKDCYLVRYQQAVVVVPESRYVGTKLAQQG